MGPSYLWFLFYELVSLGEEFGLSRERALSALCNMLIGAARTMNESGLPPEEVMDLIPARPFAEEEEKIKEIYRHRIFGIFKKTDRLNPAGSLGRRQPGLSRNVIDDLFQHRRYQLLRFSSILSWTSRESSAENDRPKRNKAGKYGK